MDYTLTYDKTRGRAYAGENLKLKLSRSKIAKGRGRIKNI